MRLLEVENSLEAFGWYLCIRKNDIWAAPACRTVDSCTNSCPLDFTRRIYASFLLLRARELLTARNVADLLFGRRNPFRKMSRTRMCLLYPSICTISELPTVRNRKPGGIQIVYDVSRYEVKDITRKIYFEKTNFFNYKNEMESEWN